MSRASVPARRYGPFEDFSSDMERMFDTVLGRTFGTMLRNGNGDGHAKFLPTMDLAETPKDLRSVSTCPASSRGSQVGTARWPPGNLGQTREHHRTQGQELSLHRASQRIVHAISRAAR